MVPLVSFLIEEQTTQVMMSLVVTMYHGAILVIPYTARSTIQSVLLSLLIITMYSWCHTHHSLLRDINNTVSLDEFPHYNVAWYHWRHSLHEITRINFQHPSLYTGTVLDISAALSHHCFSVYKAN